MSDDKLDLFIGMTNNRFDKTDAMTNNRFDKVDEDVKEVNRKMDLVLSRNNFIYGGVFVLSAIVSYGITIVFGR